MKLKYWEIILKYWERIDQNVKAIELIDFLRKK